MRERTCMASAPFQPQPAVKHRTTSLLLRHVAGGHRHSCDTSGTACGRPLRCEGLHLDGGHWVVSGTRLRLTALSPCCPRSRPNDVSTSRPPSSLPQSRTHACGGSSPTFPKTVRSCPAFSHCGSHAVPLMGQCSRIRPAVYRTNRSYPRWRLY